MGVFISEKINICFHNQVLNLKPNLIEIFLVIYFAKKP